MDCYHPSVSVYEGEELSFTGKDSLRERYQSLFADWDFGAEVTQRLVHAQHCIDDETWWRIAPDSGERSEGRLLVQYTERDGTIAVVRFLDGS